MSEGAPIDPTNESVYSLVFGDITGGDLIQLFMSSNYLFLDNRREDIRRGLQTALNRYGQNTKALTDKIVADILPLLVSEELSAASEEGFDATLVAREVL